MDHAKSIQKDHYWKMLVEKKLEKVKDCDKLAISGKRKGDVYRKNFHDIHNNRKLHLGLTNEAHKLHRNKLERLLLYLYLEQIRAQLYNMKN